MEDLAAQNKAMQEVLAELTDGVELPLQTPPPSPPAAQVAPTFSSYAEYKAWRESDQSAASTTPAPPSPATIEQGWWNPDAVQIPGAVPEYLIQRPEYLDGTLAGDIGFDPLCLMAFSWPVFQEHGTRLFDDLSGSHRRTLFLQCAPAEQRAAVQWMRASELKHARLAMLAAIGWPLAELVQSDFLHAYPFLNGRAPSLFNGALLDVYAPFCLFAVAAFGLFEVVTTEHGLGVGGDYHFDPLTLAATASNATMRDLQRREIANGRLAMLAITGYALQEFVYGTPVVDQTPLFFTFFGDLLAPGATASLGIF